MRRSYSTDRLLWAIIALGLFTAFGFVNPLPGMKEDYRFWADVWLVLEGKHGNEAMVIGQALLLAVPAVALGWLAQAVAVVCGVRLSDRPALAQAADYDDARPDPGVPFRDDSFQNG